MRVEFSRFVADDLDAIAAHIAQDSTEHALHFLQQVRAKIHILAAHPRAYRLRPEIGRDARMALVGHYAILFRICSDHIRVERVLYGGRDLLALLQD